jgi:hypothetical protein
MEIEFLCYIVVVSLVKSISSVLTQVRTVNITNLLHATSPYSFMHVKTAVHAT